MKIINVRQGQYQISDDPNVVLTTVLGSCIAVCLHDHSRNIGGMNHFLLPGTDISGQSSERYGVNAMELLINNLSKAGATRETLVAKVFGGAAMWDNLEKIGISNAQFAKDFLNQEGISCEFASVGGRLARKLKFHPANGQAQQFLVPKDMLPEKSPASAPPILAAKYDITLF